MLPDLLAPDLRVVFCGTAVSTTSAKRGHYYSGQGNRFWQLLHDSGFTPQRMEPEQDATLPAYGIGITDLVKHIAQSHDRGLDYRAARQTAAHVIAANPQWLAFNGLAAARAAARQLGTAPKQDVTLGEQHWRVGPLRVYVLPSSSAANTSMPYATKREHWARFRELVDTDGAQGR